MTLVFACPSGFWTCEDTHRCINGSKICDGVPDCLDKSDEDINNCFTMVMFPDTIDKKGNGKKFHYFITFKLNILSLIFIPYSHMEKSN